MYMYAFIHAVYLHTFCPQENITEESFEEVTETLAELIVNSGKEDQTEDNFAVVVDVFVGTAALSNNSDVIIDVPVSYTTFK